MLATGCSPSQCLGSHHGYQYVYGVTGRVVSQDDGLTSSHLRPSNMERYGYRKTIYQIHKQGRATHPPEFRWPRSISWHRRPAGGNRNAQLQRRIRCAHRLQGPLNNQTQFTYDSSGFLCHARMHKGMSPPIRTTQRTMSSAARMKQQGHYHDVRHQPPVAYQDRCGGRCHAYTYNAMGLLATVTAPGAG